jgi:hypothetical protein
MPAPATCKSTDDPSVNAVHDCRRGGLLEIPGLRYTDPNSVCYNSAQSMDRCSVSR